MSGEFLLAPPAGPVMCYPCVTATCGHRRCEGMIPALTFADGTALCLDCASDRARKSGRGARAAGRPAAPVPARA